MLIILYTQTNSKIRPVDVGGAKSSSKKLMNSCKIEGLLEKALNELNLTLAL